MNRFARMATLALLIAATSLLAWAGVKVAGGQYKVEDSNGVKIGNAGVSADGGVIGYVDDPNTSHPPDQNAVWNWNASLGMYVDEDGYRVEFTVIGGGAGYLWAKRDSGGNIVDAGTMYK